MFQAIFYYKHPLSDSQVLKSFLSVRAFNKKKTIFRQSISSKIEHEDFIQQTRTKYFLN